MDNNSEQNLIWNVDTNIHLLPFSHLQKRGLECRYTVRTHTEEKLSKISNIKIRHFAFFSCKYLS